MNKTRAFSLLLALVVLISCLPMIPVAADEIYSLDGSWQFTGDFRSLIADFYFDYSFYCEDTLFYGFVYYVEDDELWFLTSESDEVCVYDGGDGYYWTTDLGRPVISFAERVQVTYDEYMFFEFCLTQIEDEPVVYSTSISIGDTTYEFTGTDASPLVAMTVDIDGCTLSDGVNTYQYTYSGSGTFKGFSSSAEGSVSYSIGSTWNFGGKSGLNSQYTIYPIAEISVQAYYSTINIGSSQFVFSSTVSTPEVTIIVNDTGASLTDGSKTFTYTYSGEGTFQGLSFSATGVASLVPGESYPLAAGDHTLYAIASTVGEFVLSAGQWEANKSLASAANEYVALSAWPDGLTSVPLSFISSGQTFSSMSYQSTIQYGNCLFYEDSRVYGFDTLAAISDPGWKMDAYALVYFATDQSVPEAFYSWFTSNFKYVGSDSVDPIYTATINIYDMTGVSLLATWSLSAPGTCPSFTFTVLDNGILVSGDDTWTWTGAGDPFYGFSFNAGSTIVSFAPGEVSSVSGTAADLTFSLYLVSDLSEKVYQTGVLGWFQKLFDMIAELPDKIRKAIFGEDVLNSVNDASSVLGSTGLFRQAYNALYAGWGLRDLLEDPDGPFAWLLG